MPGIFFGQGHPDVFQGGQIWEQVIELENEPNLFLASGDDGVEGIHIVGSELYFWFVESGYLNGKERKDENKNRQYIMVIDKNLLKGGK